MKKNYLLGLILPFLFSVNQRLNAQSTNPAPFCYPTASNMTGGTCTGNYGFNIQSVKVNTLSQSSGCYGSGVNDVYRYWSSTTSLYSGGKYSFTITTPQSTSSYPVSTGYWIDFNRNNRFEASEFSGSSLFNSNNVSPYVTHNIGLTVPCNATPGKTRLRVMVQGFTRITSTDTCKVPSGYGEIWDFDVTIVQPGTLTAGMSMPAQAFVKTVVKINYSNINEYTFHDLDLNNDGTWEQKGASYPYLYTNASTWPTTGTKCIKLRSSNCFSSDSVVKCISIVNPTTPPVVGFTKVSPCEKVVEVYSGIDLVDTSGQGPYIWRWNIYDSLTFKNDPFDPISNENSGYVVFENGTTNTSKSPHVSFYREGIYCVELIATNGVGTSKFTKKSYVKVIKPTLYYLGFGSYGPNSDNRVTSDYGQIIDDGGPNGNYSNNSGKAKKTFLIINPVAASPITIAFSQIKLKDANDSILIYDDDKINNSKLLAAITYASNGTTPTYTSTLNKMYFYFRSDSSGVDSGYKAEYTNSGVFKMSGKPNISIGHNLLFVNQKSFFYNENESVYGFNYDRIWSVNDTVQTAYNNLDTLQYKFKYAGTQKVCLEMKGCSATYKNCKNLVFESGLMGVVYKDNNSNCAYNSGEKVMPNIHMKLFDSTTNSWSHYFTNNLGQYNFNKGFGTYKAVIDADGMPFRTICRTPGTDSMFRLSGTTPYRVINFDIGCKANYDLGVQSVWTNGIIFPGRKHELHVSAGDMNKWFGLNCTSGLSGSVVITVSGKVSYVSNVSGTLSPTSVSGNVFTYTVSDFSQININNDFGLIFKTDTSAKAGDTISVKVRIMPLSSDNDTSNNTFKYRYRVSNSKDPNMKEVYPDELTDGFKDWITYTIHFQNTGNAQAFDIRLQDTLDNLLDPETFQLLSYSHPLSTTLVSKVLTFNFKDIMLPDSNTNEKGSHGFVQFRIKPKTPLSKGSVIKNKAFIYFDFNNPIVTNTVNNEIYPRYVVIPDPNFAAWLDKKYPGAIRNGNLLDTSWANIKNELMVNVRNKNIASVFGIQFFNSLVSLDCSGNQLTTLPELPSKLNALVCGNNKLTNLPVLPSGLAVLDCSGSGLTSLPALPSSLLMLLCENNQLSKLPALPGTMTTLHCNDNLLTELPSLPAVLNEMDCRNNKISCFEKFAESISILYINGNNNKCLPNYIAAMDAGTKAIPLCIKGDLINNPGACSTTVPPLVFIPDVNFATWLSILYPGAMYNGSWLDTAYNDIKIATAINAGSKNIANLFGIQFFTSLKTLNCSSNILTSLPVLPGTLTHLNCSDNKITGLPAIPNTLQALLCENNKLTALPSLPPALDYLSCSNNAIVSLPVLPASLKNLYCDFNQLDQLPALPSAVSILHCESNKLVNLPFLPSLLSQLYCNNNAITCFDKFSDNITVIDISSNKNKCLPNYISAMDAATKAMALCIKGDSINNPDKCLSTLQISIKQISNVNIDLKVYPNPGKGIFNIEIPDNLTGANVKIEVYNVLGELVATYSIIEDIAEIDITSQPKGIYVVKLLGKDLVISKCIIKE